jgi:hypothetical protein
MVLKAMHTSCGGENRLELTPRKRASLEKLTVAHPIKKLIAIYAPKVSLPRSHGSYPEPYEQVYSSQPCIPFFEF